MAATRLGCVHAISLPFVWGKSEYATNCGILQKNINKKMSNEHLNALSGLSRSSLSHHDNNLVITELF